MSKCYRSKCYEIISSEVGYLEKKTAELKYLYDKTANAGNKDNTKYAYEMNQSGKGKGLLNGNKQGTYYCAVLQVWTICKACDWDLNKARKVLCLDGSVDEGGAAASATALKNYFKAKGRYDKNPKEGDLIIFNYNGDSKMDHVGRVYKVTDSMVYTIEGNTKKDGKGGVWKKSYKRSNSNIDGYCHPKYDEEPPKEDSYMFEVKKVKKGTNGADTLLCQRQLYAMGYKGKNKLPLALDSKCGENTVYAIKIFQQDCVKKGIKLEINGICDQTTWKYLLGV